MERFTTNSNFRSDVQFGLDQIKAQIDLFASQDDAEEYKSIILLLEASRVKIKTLLGNGEPIGPDLHNAIIDEFKVLGKFLGN